ncbi:hypothetical protein Pst134EA_022961 [Puccinia striiformis f. sp. tritici]|uniref:hypothetical protein n=1 Tax=Puccinia striiformis f. sp. tritici TaxID=168172 RepID=UPI002007C374|nr:hypothetical protein Pst134EA_022961 [Puccinia striiformis f. sp. tritici]KAH9455499.1 hypothetical protein Pst134EA_022961 [Puccinia striiformis f. sp. tritici]
MMIMACTNGNDGYPCQAEFNRRMEHYIVRKKRSERTVVSEGELAIIYHLLSDPAAMRAEADVSHRTWVKKTFMLKSFVNGTFVCHKDKGQSIAQPVASKEKMYFILKQAHASEGHGGRDKTAKAVKKTHSFIRKGLICLFLEVCPTCRARNDAVKKDKLANAQNANEAASPLSHLESASSIDSWDQSSSQLHALHSANPYQSSSFHPTSPLYPLEDAQRLTIPVLSTALRRAPSHGVVGTLFPDPGNSHARSHTFPNLDLSYHLPQDQFGQSPVGYASPSPLLSAVGSQVGSQVGSHAGSQVGSVYESYNTDHLNELTTALQQQSFCAPIFSVQVDAPAHESGLPGHEFFLDDQAYYNLQQPQHQHQTSSDAQNSPGSSSNLYDPINVPYLLTSQPDNLYQSSSAPTQFASFSHLASGSQHDRSASNSSVQAHGDNYNKNQMSTVGSTASLEFHSYDPMSSYNPADAGLPDSFAPIPPQDTQRRSFQDKNHKHLSLQTIDTSQDIQGNFRNNNHDSGSYSGPSTAGSMWTTAEDMSTPLLTGDFHDLMSSLSAPAENLRRDDSQVLNF